MGSRKRILVLLFLLIILLSCGGLYRWLYRPPIQVEELNLPKEFFPADIVTYQTIHSPREPLPAIDAGIQTVYWKTGIGVFNVKRLPTIGLARRVYNAYANVGAYTQFTEQVYHSDLADEYSAGCGMSSFGGFRCDFVARYREYAVALNVIINEEMTIDEFNEIVAYVDEVFANGLSR